MVITLFVGVGGISRNCLTSLGFISGFLKVKNLFKYRGLISRMFRPVFFFYAFCWCDMVIMTSSFINANFCFMRSYRVSYFAICAVLLLNFCRLIDLLGVCYFAIDAILLLYLHQCSQSLRGLLFCNVCYFDFKFHSYTLRGVLLLKLDLLGSAACLLHQCS